MLFIVKAFRRVNLADILIKYCSSEEACGISGRFGLKILKKVQVCHKIKFSYLNLGYCSGARRKEKNQPLIYRNKHSAPKGIPLKDNRMK